VSTTLYASTTLTQLDTSNHLHALYRQTNHLSNSISNHKITTSSTSSRYISTVRILRFFIFATAETESGQYERSEE
jgi:hypothetical protein